MDFVVTDSFHTINKISRFENKYFHSITFYSNTIRQKKRLLHSLPNTQCLSSKLSGETSPLCCTGSQNIGKIQSNTTCLMLRLLTCSYIIYLNDMFRPLSWAIFRLNTFQCAVNHTINNVLLLSTRFRAPSIKFFDLKLITVIVEIKMLLQYKRYKKVGYHNHERGVGVPESGTISVLTIFNYSVNGGTEEDVASRIKKANGIFVQLHPVWRNHNILKGVKNMNIQYKCEVSIIICL